MILTLFACASTWSATDPLREHRSRLDADHDERVTAAEYEAHLWNGPPFGTADVDGDGDLSSAELATLIAAQQPTVFDGFGKLEVIRRGGAGVASPRGQARDTWEVLVWMNDALRAAGEPGLAPDDVAAAVATGHLGSPESASLLAALKPAWEAHGWAWPAGLP